MLENANPEDLRRLADAMRERGDQAAPGDPGRGTEGVTQARPSGERTPPTGPWDGKTEMVDARPRVDRSAADGARVISEWSGDPSRDPSAPSSPGATGERVRAAAAGAERAVEQQVVPAQYGPFVRRVFRKYVERAATERPGVPASPGPAVPDAPDVKPR